MHDTLSVQLEKVKEHEPLAPHTTFKIGGPARYFFVARSTEDMTRAIRAAAECGIPFFVLAGGSNILVADKGFNGLVISNEIQEFRAEVRLGRALVTVGAGESWDDIVERCVSKDWAGIECLSGIPGKVGSAPVQNIGAYGQSVSTVVSSVEAIDCTDGSLRVFNNAQCEFGYRTSLFKKSQGRYSITRVTFALTPHGRPPLTYHDLKEYFSGKSPSLLEVRSAVIEIRAKKGYVIMPEYECYKTAGSFFLNPVITGEQFRKIKDTVHGCADPWYWELPNGNVKVSAACLLQSAGFSKGYRTGEVGISPKHSLSIVNFGNAKAQEIVALANEIKARVKEKFNVALEEEVQFIGF